MSRGRSSLLPGFACVCLLAGNAPAQTVIGFEGFANGREVGSGTHGIGAKLSPLFFELAGISGGTPIQGASIFDSDPFGPNASGADRDLLVDLGNILILQNDVFATQTLPGFYDIANDEERGGTLIFDFLDPVEMLSIDLIDVDNHGAVTLTLLDADGNIRTYEVPSFWTFDIFADGMGGYDTLDLTSLADQVGEAGGIATAIQDPFFDPLDVVRLTIVHQGSGGVDNLAFVPAPSALLVVLAGLVGFRRRRRSWSH